MNLCFNQSKANIMALEEGGADESFHPATGLKQPGSERLGDFFIIMTEIEWLV